MSCVGKYEPGSKPFCRNCVIKNSSCTREWNEKTKKRQTNLIIRKRNAKLKKKLIYIAPKLKQVNKMLGLK